MHDVEQFSEHSPKARMAWSSRPVWNRRSPRGRRPDPYPHLDMAPTDHNRRDSGNRHLQRTPSMAKSKSLVAKDFSQARLL
jgi:hypothetical protein